MIDYDSYEFTFDFVMLFSTLPLPSSSSSSSVRSQSPVSISLPCRPLAVEFPHQNWIFSQIFPVKGEFILGSVSWFSKVFSDNHWCYFKKKNKQKKPQINNYELKLDLNSFMSSTQSRVPQSAVAFTCSLFCSALFPCVHTYVCTCMCSEMAPFFGSDRVFIHPCLWSSCMNPPVLTWIHIERRW